MRLEIWDHDVEAWTEVGVRRGRREWEWWEWSVPLVMAGMDGTIRLWE
jgi:hypothetical protein